MACDTSGPMTASSADVLAFWFSDRARKLWFEKNTAFDDEIRDRFGSLVEGAIAGEYGEWTADADGALALVIALDQFPRNMFRGSPRSFSGDARARQIAETAINNGLDLAQPLDRRAFFYLPYQHSESLDDQNRSIELYTKWAAAHPEADRASAEGDLTYVHRHHEIIRRFGRFPHRNAVLGRASTPEEIEFLAGPNSSF